MWAQSCVSALLCYFTFLSLSFFICKRGIIYSSLQNLSGGGGEEKGAVQVWVPDWLGKREVLLGSSIDSTRITDLTEE